MKIFNIFYLFAVIAICSCKKDNLEPTKNEVRLISDSISFTINNQFYYLNSQNEISMSNRQINIKPSSSQISGRNAAYTTGGFFWYGEPDSTLYDISYGFVTDKYLQSFKISFSKKYRNDQLIKHFPLLIPQNNFEILKIGKQPFAIDINKENTTEGISIEFKTNNIAGDLSSYIPGFSILVRTNLSKNIQDNSTFEITKVQKLDEIFHLIEAKFSLNLFDENGKLYRLENGYSKFKVEL